MGVPTSLLVYFTMRVTEIMKQFDDIFIQLFRLFTNGPSLQRFSCGSVAQNAQIGSKLALVDVWCACLMSLHA